MGKLPAVSKRTKVDCGEFSGLFLHVSLKKSSYQIKVHFSQAKYINI